MPTSEVGLRARHLVAAGCTDNNLATEINLVEYTDHGAALHIETPHQTDQLSLARLALLVDDVDEAFATLSRHPDLHIICAPKDIVINDTGTESISRWFSFRDPFGVFITITARPDNEERTLP